MIWQQNAGKTDNYFFRLTPIIVPITIKSILEINFIISLKLKPKIKQIQTYIKARVKPLIRPLLFCLIPKINPPIKNIDKEIIVVTILEIL